LSGPLLDRLDVHLEVPSVRGRDLAHHAGSLLRAETEGARRRIAAARAAQAARARSLAVAPLNARLVPAELDRAGALEPGLRRRLVHAIELLGLSARGVHRTWRLARTLADLAGEEVISASALDEALTLRRREVERR
jgi:magnesium chelatase family protein